MHSQQNPIPSEEVAFGTNEEFKNQNNVKQNSNDTFKKRPWRTAIRILCIAVCIVLIPVIVVNSVLIVKSFLYPDKVPDFLGYKPFVVNSGSMEPGVNIGDLTICQTIDPAQLVVNDVVAYKLGNNEVVLHQIIEVLEIDGQPVYRTKGTANNAPDVQLVTAAQIEGILRHDIPKVGSIAMFLQTPTGIILFVVTPLILFILYDILIRKRRQHRQNKKEDALQAEIDRLKAMQGMSS